MWRKQLWLWGGSKGVIIFPWIFSCNAEFSPCWALPEYIRALIHMACFRVCQSRRGLNTKEGQTRMSLWKCWLGKTEIRSFILPRPGVESRPLHLLSSALTYQSKASLISFLHAKRPIVQSQLAQTNFVNKAESLTTTVIINIFDLQQCLLAQDTCSTPQWGAADAEFKVPSDENTELNVLPLKPGVCQFIAMHATLNARDFFLANFYPSGTFTCILSKTSPNFFLC